MCRISINKARDQSESSAAVRHINNNKWKNKFVAKKKKKFHYLYKCVAVRNFIKRKGKKKKPYDFCGLDFYLYVFFFVIHVWVATKLYWIDDQLNHINTHAHTLCTIFVRLFQYNNIFFHEFHDDKIELSCYVCWDLREDGHISTKQFTCSLACNNHWLHRYRQLFMNFFLFRFRIQSNVAAVERYATTSLISHQYCTIKWTKQ